MAREYYATMPQWKYARGLSIEQMCDLTETIDAVLAYCNHKTDACPTGYKSAANAFRKRHQWWFEHPHEYDYAEHEDYRYDIIWMTRTKIPCLFRDRNDAW